MKSHYLALTAFLFPFAVNAQDAPTEASRYLTVARLCAATPMPGCSTCPSSYGRGIPRSSRILRARKSLIRDDVEPRPDRFSGRFMYTVWLPPWR